MTKATTTAESLYNQVKHCDNYRGLYQTLIKRIIDILFCLISMPFFLIILIVVAPLIKFEDGGPVFYHSMRLGRDFKEFEMLKFRTMAVNAPDIRNEDGSTFNSSSDPRVTKFGGFLRKNSLDELPQIFNVLLGQMSIIGPRAGDVESKNSYMEDEKGKALVRPGITGYTQAYYRNSLSVREKRLFDASYAHSVSFLLDVRIFFKTISTVVKHENLYTNE